MRLPATRVPVTRIRAAGERSERRSRGFSAARGPENPETAAQRRATRLPTDPRSHRRSTRVPNRTPDSGAGASRLRRDVRADAAPRTALPSREPFPHPAPGEAPSATDTAALPERPSPPGRASRWPFSPTGASALSEGLAIGACSVGAAAAAALRGDRLLLRLPRGPGHLLRLGLLLRGPLRL
jgi:hypothetical protein